MFCGSDKEIRRYIAYLIRGTRDTSTPRFRSMLNNPSPSIEKIR
jgi:hypothetical protein